jgi:hypothetical protein
MTANSRFLSGLSARFGKIAFVVPPTFWSMTVNSRFLSGLSARFGMTRLI